MKVLQHLECHLRALHDLNALLAILILGTKDHADLEPHVWLQRLRPRKIDGDFPHVVLATRAIRLKLDVVKVAAQCECREHSRRRHFAEEDNPAHRGCLGLVVLIVLWDACPRVYFHPELQRPTP